MHEEKYFLREGVYLCSSHGYWVALDIDKDLYIGLDKAKLELIGNKIHGFDVAHSSNRGGLSSANSTDDEYISELLSAGILTSEQRGAKPLSPPLSPPKSALVLQRTLHIGASSVGFVLNFFLAAHVANTWLRDRALSETVQTVRNRRDRSKPLPSGFDVHAASTLIAAFIKLRPLYPRSSLCMFDSLACLNFLARYSLFPQWVFGVTMDPFHAHCWLQHGDVVLNDTLTNVAPYTPIMCV